MIKLKEPYQNKTIFEVMLVSLIVIFLLAIVLSVLLRFTDSGYPFGLFKLFLAYTAVYQGAKEYLHILTNLVHTKISECK